MVRLASAALALAAGAWVAVGAECGADGRCTELSDEETTLLQLHDRDGREATVNKHRSVRQPPPGQKNRIRIVGNKFMMKLENGTDIGVVPLGGNYVVKAQPYFPPEDVIRANAKSMYDGALAMEYKPSDGRKVVPVVRLGTLFEAAMPHGPTLDTEWVAKLKKAVEIFAEEGVYVVLDSHSDAWSSTNGGEGFPYWMTQYMQETDPKHSYVISPKYPLKTVVPDGVNEGLQSLNVSGVPQVAIVDDENPWFQYSIDDKEPWKMNVGNRNVRANNNDEQWSAGVLPMSLQSNNIAERFYHSPTRRGTTRCSDSKRQSADREKIFQPFVDYMCFLATVWQDHANVIAIEVLNEPPVAGLGCLPSLVEAVYTRQNLFNFYSHLLEELDDVPAVYALEDVLGSVPGGSVVDSVLIFQSVQPDDLQKIQDRAAKGQLIFAFHYYYGIASTLTFAGQIQAAMESEFGNMALFLSEYWDSSTEVTAQQLSEAAELGVGMVTYWQHADASYTGNDGWYKYSPEVQAAGGPTASDEAWASYSKTVADGTYWGAAITGAGGAKDNVLKLVKNVPAAVPH